MKATSVYMAEMQY